MTQSYPSSPASPTSAASPRGSAKKRPDPFSRSPTLIVSGVLLLILGIGNWRIGTVKLHQYEGRMAEAVARGGQDVKRPFLGTVSILDHRTEAHELYEKSLIKRNQYRIVHRGGRVLTVLGAMFVLAALARRRTQPRVR